MAQLPSMPREAILIEREKTHGNFQLVAKVAQEIKNSIGWAPSELDGRQKEALDLIATKIARIVCGNPKERDHWDDIAGYAKLGAEACE